MKLRTQGQNGKFSEFVFQEDWSKTIPLQDNKIMVTGGSWQLEDENLPPHIRPLSYSKKVFIIDTMTGIVERKPDMAKKRQAHGMVLVKNYVYCCGGLSGWDIL